MSVKKTTLDFLDTGETILTIETEYCGNLQRVSKLMNKHKLQVRRLGKLLEKVMKKEPE